METPVIDFLRRFSDSGTSRFFMPGHKGRLELSASFDITEIEGADFLLASEGIIARSESLTASLYGAAHTLYSTQGSTLAILAMIAAAVPRGGALIAGRNCHAACVNGMALLDLTPVFVAGSTVSRATLHNIDFVNERDIICVSQIYINQR